MHEYSYIHTNDKVKTVWGFYSKGKYYQPINSKKVGKEVDVKQTRPYTAMSINLNPLEQCMYQS